MCRYHYVSDCAEEIFIQDHIAIIIPGHQAQYLEDRPEVICRIIAAANAGIPGHYDHDDIPG